MRLLDSKVSAEGRVSIPADIRHQLGLEPGDRVLFLVEENGENAAVRMVTARWLAEQVWAANGGGDGADAADLVRAAREASDRADDRWADEPFETPAASSEDGVLAVLFPAA